MKMKKSLALLSAVLCFSNANVSQVDGLVGVSIDWLSLDKSKNILGKGAAESVKFKRSSAALYNILVGFLYNCGNGFRVGPEFSYGFANKKSRVECSEGYMQPSVDRAQELIGSTTTLVTLDPTKGQALRTRLTNTDNYNRKLRSVGTISLKVGGALNSDVSIFALLGYAFANIKVRYLPGLETGTDKDVFAADRAFAVLMDSKKNKAAKPKKHGFAFGLEGAVKVAPNCSISARAMYATSIKLWRVGVAVVANF